MQAIKGKGQKDPNGFFERLIDPIFILNIINGEILNTSDECKELIEYCSDGHEFHIMFMGSIIYQSYETGDIDESCFGKGKNESMEDFLRRRHNEMIIRLQSQLLKKTDSKLLNFPKK